MKTRIRDLREDKDWTQQMVANFLHCNQSLYSRYESNKRELPLELAVKLAQLYEVSVDYLVYLTDDPTPPKKR